MISNEENILTFAATSFLKDLHRQFELGRSASLAQRSSKKNSIDRLLERPEPEWPEKNWSVASIPPALRNRQVEITGPAEPKMVINALNSGANVFMADFEDSLSPTWENIIRGHLALQAALRRTLSFTNESGKIYRLNAEESKLATLIVRPRGWHLAEKNFEVDGEPMSASLFDFGLYLFHGGVFGVETGRGPFFYLPKLESSSEARLWSQVFRWSEDHLKIPRGSIRATVLIETLPGAIAMEEILYELRDYVVGLNAGRWDYLFSMIKSLAGTQHELTFPDRGQLTMAVPFMRRYAEKIVAVCKRRKATPIGGMSALIPSRHDAKKNERALLNVRADKEREARQGFLGTWVAHPDLVPIAREAFNSVERMNQNTSSITAEATARDLLPRASEEPFLSFTPTYQGALVNIDVALRYLAFWLNGLGAVAIHGLMEDAATAEISRMQLWQWRKNRVTLDNGETVSNEWLRATIRRCKEDIRSTEILNNGKINSLSIAESDLNEAEVLLLELTLSESNSAVPFLTLPAMDRLNRTRNIEGEKNVDSTL